MSTLKNARLLLFALATLVCFSMVSHHKAYAAVDCSTFPNGGASTSPEGLIVRAQVLKAGGIFQANTTTTNGYTMELKSGGGTKPAGIAWTGNDGWLDSNHSSIYDNVTFSPTANYCSTGTYSYQTGDFILKFGGTSKGKPLKEFPLKYTSYNKTQDYSKFSGIGSDYSRYWLLYCGSLTDTSAISGRLFTATMKGNPSGTKAGGYWVVTFTAAQPGLNAPEASSISWNLKNFKNGQTAIVYATYIEPTTTISTSSSSTLGSAYPGTSVTLTNNINVSNVQGTGTDGYSFDITDTSVGGTLPGTGTASGTKKYTDGNLSSPYVFTIPSNTTASKYCRKISISNNASYASVSNAITEACVNVTYRTTTISTSSSSTLGSAYPGTSVTLTNNINVSNVQGTGTDGYSFDITDTSVGGTLPGTGTASGTKKYTDGNLSSPYVFTIPSNTTASKYCRKISISNNASYASVSNAITEACVNVTYPPVLTCSNSDYQETGFNGTIGYTVTNNNSTSITYGVNASINSLTSLSITPSNSIPVTSNSAVNGTVSFGTPLPIGQYTLKINLTDNGNQVATVNCGLNIVLRPYFKVYGGGVMTGSNFMNSNGTCTNNTSANIVAFNNGTNGSSTDQAIFSSGYVYGMGSQQSTTSSGTSLLTFANTPNTPNTIFGNYGAIGGSFEGIQCMPDYYSQLKSLQGALVDTATSPNIYNFNQGVNIYTGGDVKISGNITLTNTITSAGLPFMYIIAYGHDIYIDNVVNEVDAVLIAEPNNGTGGHIYTCEDNQNNAFSSCKNKPLTIKGALLASQVYLLRTGYNNFTASSSVNATGGCETSFKGAEQICMSPLYWLTNPFSEITNTTTTTTDYIQQLPPTL